MKITTVRYRRLQSHDRGYGHDAFEAEAQVGDDETADQALTALRVWVDGQIEHSRVMDRLIGNHETLAERLASRQREYDGLKKDVDAARAVLRKCDKLVTLARANGLAAEAGLLDAAIDGVPF